MARSSLSGNLVNLGSLLVIRVTGRAVLFPQIHRDRMVENSATELGPTRAPEASLVLGTSSISFLWSDCVIASIAVQSWPSYLTSLSLSVCIYEGDPRSHHAG